MKSYNELQPFLFEDIKNLVVQWMCTFDIILNQKEGTKKIEYSPRKSYGKWFGKWYDICLEIHTDDWILINELSTSDIKYTIQTLVDKCEHITVTTWKTGIFTNLFNLNSKIFIIYQKGMDHQEEDL